MRRAVSTGGDAPCAGSVKRRGVGDSMLKGSQDFAGAGKGGTERKGSQTYDRKAFSFRRLNNADPGPKNT
jgi:hypothetical protein